MPPPSAYIAQTVAPIINAFATSILVLITIIYVWLTKRMADEMARQNRPYVFLKVGAQEDHRRDLLLVNSGNRVAQKIIMDVIKDAKIYVTNFEDEGFSDEDTKLSKLELCTQGISSLPPSAEAALGFIESRNPKMAPQLLEYTIRYGDGSGRTYKESLSLAYWC